MVSHYFTKDPTTLSKERTITYKFNGLTYQLTSDTNVFAKNGIDQGTMILLKIITKSINTGKVLDIGCGYGVIGLTLASQHPDIQVVCSDINLRAVSLTNKNARALKLSKRVISLQSNLYENIEGKFDYVVSNPPIRAGKKVLDEIYTGAYRKLNTGGTLYLVVRRKQGAESTVKRLIEIYSHVDVLVKDKGYWVIKATK